MYIKSYIVFPEPGKCDAVVTKLRAIEGCEVHPSQNSELLVLAVESESLSQEADREKLIEAIAEIKSTALVFGNAVSGSESPCNAGIGHA